MSIDFSQWFNPAYSKMPNFSKQGFFPIASDVKLEDVNGTPFAFGDLNNDKYIDMFVVDNSRRILSVYIWIPSDWNYKFLTSVTLTNEIVNVAATDFTRTGTLDIFVTMKNNNNYSFVILKFDGNSELAILSTFEKESTTFPFIIDYDNDLRPDIIFTEIGSNKASIYRNESESTFTLISNIDLPSFTELSFVDIDGDCHSDIVGRDSNNDILFYVWKETNYVKKDIGPINLGNAGKFTLLDFNRNGNLDIIYPICDADGLCKINIHLNNQITACGSALSGSSSTCRAASALCTRDENFNFKSTPDIEYDIQAKLVQSEYAPLAVHTGDFNLDGYPDVIATVVQDGIPTTLLLQNKGGKKLESYTDFSGKESLTRAGLYYSVFTDTGERGKQDILQLYYENNSHRIQILFNSFKPDALFFKATGLNGLCVGYCNGKLVSPKPYGVSTIGGTFRISLDLNDGTLISQTAPHFISTGPLSLQPPYAFLGLGRISNYIQSVAYGLSTTNNDHSFHWLGVIPNSHMVSIPYEPTQPKQWTMELFITPSGVVFWVFIAIFVSLVILVITIGFLKYREIKQDEIMKASINMH